MSDKPPVSAPDVSPQLAPCPFCGGPARIREDAKGGIVGCLPLDNTKPESSCHQNVTLYVGFSHRRGDGISRSRYNKADAIAAWNRRVESPPPAPLVTCHVCGRSDLLAGGTHTCLGASKGTT